MLGEDERQGRATARHPVQVGEETSASAASRSLRNVTAVASSYRRYNPKTERFRILLHRGPDDTKYKNDHHRGRQPATDQYGQVTSGLAKDRTRSRATSNKSGMAASSRIRPIRRSAIVASAVRTRKF